MVTIQPLKHKDTKEKNISIINSYLEEKNALQEKVKQQYSIIFVSWCLGGKITKQLQTKYILPQSRIINHYCRFLFFFDTAFG